MKHVKLFEQFEQSLLEESNLVIPVYRTITDFFKYSMMHFNKTQSAYKAIEIGAADLLKIKYELDDGFELAAYSACMIFRNAGRKTGPSYQSPECIVAPFTKWRKDHVRGSLEHGARTPEEKKEDDRRSKAFSEDMAKRDLSILVISEKPISDSLIESIFPETAKGSDKKIDYTFTRKISDYRPIGQPTYRSSRTGVWRTSSAFMAMEFTPRYFRLVQYSVKRESLQITNEEILGLQACKEFMEKTGYELVSNSRALKNQSFTFAYPKAYAYPDDPHNRLYRDSKEHLPRGITIYGSGYIRSAEVDPPPGYQPGVIAKFSNGSLEGWAAGFRKMQDVVIKWENSWFKEKGINLLISPEERQAHRGKIGGNKFGF